MTVADSGHTQAFARKVDTNEIKPKLVKKKETSHDTC